MVEGRTTIQGPDRTAVIVPAACRGQLCDHGDPIVDLLYMVGSLDGVREAHVAPIDPGMSGLAGTWDGSRLVVVETRYMFTLLVHAFDRNGEPVAENLKYPSASLGGPPGGILAPPLLVTVGPNDYALFYVVEAGGGLQYGRFSLPD